MATMNGAGIRKSNGLGGGDSWKYIVNFSDVIHSFTWKLLKVEVTVNLEPDEQFSAQWFVQKDKQWPSLSVLWMFARGYLSSTYIVFAR